MQLISLDCPACGAQLPPKDPSGQLSCEYCGTSFRAVQAKAARTVAGEAIDPRQLAQMIASELQQQREAVPSPPSMHAPPPTQTAARKRSGCAGLAIVFVSLFTLIPIGVSLLFSGALSQVPGLSSIPGVGSLLESTEPLLFDRVGGMPQPVEIDGKPAFVCRTRITSSSMRTMPRR
jgi:uncharacterized Zn finger protein (UPF0148 family)